MHRAPRPRLASPGLAAWRALGVSAAVAGAFALSATSALAQPLTATPSPGQLATAREIFAQAEGDEDAGRWQDALDKMRQVALVKSTAGVRYHIALCENHLGMLVSALDDFHGAQDQARAENAQDVLRLVGAELDLLDPRVPRLVLHVVPDGLAPTVVLDGLPLDPAHASDPRRVNPGVHSIAVSAPGRRASNVVITMHERDVMSLDIPLAPLEAPEPAVAPPPKLEVKEEAAPSPPWTWTPTRVGAAVATGAAIALVATGVGAYVAAGDAHDSGVQSCGALVSRASGACDAQRNTVRAWDWTAAGTWAGAAVAAGIAVFLWTRPARATRTGASIAGSIGPGSVAVHGSF